MPKYTKFEPNNEGQLRVETHQNGPFTFQIGTDLVKLDPLLVRINDAYARFFSMPSLSKMLNDLNKEILVSAIYSTNTIEGAEVSEQETQQAMQLTADEIQNEQQKRVYNLKQAYQYIDENTSVKQYTQLSLRITNSLDISLDENFIKKLHQIVYSDLLESNKKLPGEYRNDPKGFPTRVSDEAHGGPYTPPKGYDDIVLLMQAFIAWTNSKPITSLPILIRAPLIHFYFEIIHPFPDGNGRVGRLIETWLLQMGGYEYVSKVIATFYLKNIDKYFALFNQCRKAAEKHEKYPNTAFVEFFLEGILRAINHIQDRANNLVAYLLESLLLDTLMKDKKINTRQHLILQQLIDDEEIRDKKILMQQPWYIALYLNLGKRTKARDLQNLIDLDLISIPKNGKIRVLNLEPKIKLDENPLTSP